jgi:16S rRNA U516 pseudouridylate synthase RsuA-like enzyme
MSGTRLRLDVPHEAAGVRLDAFLAAAHPMQSRSLWKRFIEDGRVSVDGRAAQKPGLASETGDGDRGDDSRSRRFEPTKARTFRSPSRTRTSISRS